MKEIHTIARQLISSRAGIGSVLATLVTAVGSSYRRPGARLLITDDGTRIGSVSGGCLEDDIVERARTVAVSGMAQLAVYDTTSENDLIWGVGLGCHGVVQVLIERLPARPAWASEIVANLKEGRTSELAVVWRADNAGELGTRLVQGVAEARSKGMGLDDGIFVERVRPPPRLVIFGAGDDAQPLARLAKDVGWAITVADARPAFATPGRFPEADSIACGEPSTLVRLADPGPEALAVVMTHRYVHDIPILRELLSRPLAYLGLLGPRKRAYKMLDDLAAGGLSLTDDMRARLHAPVGLDIGGDSPDEVALSIVAEIQAVLTGRDGRPLRERPKPIHA